MPNQFSYDARQASSHGTQKLVQQIGITLYEAVKALVNFIGQMIKIFLSK